MKISETAKANPQNAHTHIEYYLAKGMCQEDAEKALKDRQSTFTKDKLVAKHGEAEGMRVWQERQTKWQDTLKAKPDEELVRIATAKISNSFTSGYSRISQECFWKLYNNIKFKSFIKHNVYFATLDKETNIKSTNEKDNNEYVVITNNRRVRLLDFYVKGLNKCIEFDGDYWHGKDGNIERDFIREQEIIESIGCKIYHVKEKDFKEDPKLVIEKCLEFLNG